MCGLLSLNQKISSMSKYLEKAVNDMKVQDRNFDLLHENMKILQNELAQKNEIIKSLTEIQSTVFDSASAGRNDQTIADRQQQEQQQSLEQQLLEHNHQTMYEQHQQLIQQNQHIKKIQLPQQQRQQQQKSLLYKKQSINK